MSERKVCEVNGEIRSVFIALLGKAITYFQTKGVCSLYICHTNGTINAGYI